MANKVLTFVIGVLVCGVEAFSQRELLPLQIKGIGDLRRPRWYPLLQTHFFCRSFQEAPGSGGTGRCGEPPWKTGHHLVFCDTAIHGGYICYQMFPGCGILFNFTFTLPACKSSHTESQRRKLAPRLCHL